MNRIFRLMLIVVPVAAVFAMPGLARAADEGTISGRVVNASAGGSTVGFTTVSLIEYSNGAPATTRRNTTADSQGRFEFSGLSTDNGVGYAVTAAFQSANYTSPSVTLTSVNASQTVELRVYDSTKSDEAIQVSNGHLVVFASQGTLEVMEVWRFNNTGDKTLIQANATADSPTLRFTLPAGATSLSSQEGSGLLADGSLVFYTAPVLPGVTDINFSYLLPFEGSVVTLSRTSDYPIADFQLLVQDNGVEVSSVVLNPGTSRDLNGTAFTNFAASNVKKGTILQASFSGIPESANTAPATLPVWPWLLGGTAILGVVATFAYYRRRGVQTAVASANHDELPNANRQGQADALLLELARLDDEFAVGSVRETEYRRQRARAKAYLIDMYRNGGL